MKIIDRIQELIDKGTYNFCETDFDLYLDDLVEVYDKKDGTCILSEIFGAIDEADENILNESYQHEELRKQEDKEDMIVRFYINFEKIEQPINATTKFI